MASELRQLVNATAAGPRRIVDARKLAREANHEILQAAEGLAQGTDTHDAQLISFFCECGCLNPVMATAANYRQHGGRLPGHRANLKGL